MQRRGRAQRVLFATVTTVVVVGLVFGLAELLARNGVMLFYATEDIAVFVSERLLRTDGDRVRTTTYAELNSPSGSLPLEPGEMWTAATLGGSFMFGDPYGEAG